jgi:hypothetical protein
MTCELLSQALEASSYEIKVSGHAWNSESEVKRRSGPPRHLGFGSGQVCATFSPSQPGLFRETRFRKTSFTQYRKW